MCVRFLRLVLIVTFVAIITSFAAGCRKASLNGEYRVEFRWQNGALKSARVALANKPGEVQKSDQDQVARVSEPIIRDSIHSANLSNAVGMLRVVILGEPPHFVEIRELKIMEPDFQDLYAAVQLQDVERIRRIVAEYHNVNQRALPSLQTSLGIAASGGYVRSLRILLDLGADPNIPDHIGVTPLMAAVTADSEDAVRMLIAAGANVTAVNKAGDSAVSLARNLHRENLLPLLLRSGKNM